MDSTRIIAATSLSGAVACLCMVGGALAQSAGGAPPAGGPGGGPGGGGGGPSGMFYQPPGEPDSHKLLSPTMGMPARRPAATPSADPRNFEGTYTKTRGYNALIQVSADANAPLVWSKPPFTPDAEKIFWNRVESENAGTPVADAGIACKPMGASRAMNAEFGWHFLMEGHELIVMTNEDHLVRRIEIGGKHPAKLAPSYMGHSVGKWEGDTLVVDTVGFNDRTWLDFDGTPHSTQLHLVERLRKIQDGYQIEDLMTIDDPVMYTKPWTVRMLYSWAPITEPSVEIICEENGVQLLDYTGKDLQPHL